MSTKTIAVENSVYERLAREKRGSESFTKTIDRLIDAASSGTCASAVAEAASLWQAIGNDAEAGQMERIVRQNRKSTTWKRPVRSSPGGQSSSSGMARPPTRQRRTEALGPSEWTSTRRKRKSDVGLAKR